MVNVVLVFDSRGESCLALGHRGVVVVTLDAAHVLAARKMPMHPQKNTPKDTEVRSVMPLGVATIVL